jgi:hypothetical protein
MTIERSHTAGTLRVLALVACNLLPAASMAQEPQSPESRGKDAAAPISSVYTDISPQACKTLESGHPDEPGAGYAGECRGPAGYKLIIEEDDDRSSATVVTPDGDKHPLDYWQVITPSFSSLGNKAEWRVTRRQGRVFPTALIIRVNASEVSADTSKITSYLAVAKITSGEICVTDRIKPTPAANDEARRAADVSVKKPCLQSP